jgi:hypothetical protein
MVIVSTGVIICHETFSPLTSAELPFVLNSFHGFFEESKLDTFDARDKFNRPIKTRQAKQQLSSLFTSGLYTLLVCSELHYSMEMLGIIQRILSSAKKFLARNIEEICVKFVRAILPQIKKFVVSLALIIFITLQIFLTFHVSSYLFFSPKIKVAPLILRC